MFTARVNSASPAAADNLVFIKGEGKDSAGNLTAYGQLNFKIADPTDSSEDGQFTIQLVEAGAYNLCLTLASTGVLAVDLGGSGGAAQVDLFDDYDDALVLRQGIQQNNRELLADMGVLERKDTGSGYMMNIQPMVRLLAGGIYQSRQLIDETKDELVRRIEGLESKLMLLEAR